MNPNLRALQPYPFQRLKDLCQDLTPSADFTPVDVSIGEPKHPPPDFILQALAEHLSGVVKYPPTPGSANLRQSIADWARQRFELPKTSLDPDQQVLPVNGTREALFAIAQCLFDQSDSRKLILIPNPFYQIYEGAALLAGAQPWFYNTPASHNYQPDFDSIDDQVWQQCQLIYLCTPGNPSGAVIPQKTLQRLLNLAEKHNFFVVSDECYSEIYPDEKNKPAGLLQAAASIGNDAFKRCIVFNSLSKRSNLPGLRSGFTAGDSEIIKSFLLYRTYHGCAMPVHTDAASTLAWQDETHVIENRRLYREKFSAVLDILAAPLSLSQPDAGFFLWPKLQQSDTDFTRRLLQEKNVKVLPGSYLSREARNINPGDRHIRLALVAPTAQCIEAAQRIVDCLN